MKSTKDIMNEVDDKLLLHYELNYVNNLKKQLQQYKQRIDELEKEYIERIVNGVYNDIYVIEDDNYYVNGETLLKEVLDDLSKLKERDEK